jgi:preprotein translocase subunit SecB
MSDNQETNINIESIILEEFQIKRKPQIPDFLIDVSKFSYDQLDINTKIDNTMTKEEDFLITKFQITIKSKEEDPSLFIICRIAGIFTQKSAGVITLKKFSETNAPALLVPYIREIISSASIKACIIPIIIPPLNVVSMVEHAKKE